MKSVLYLMSQIMYQAVTKILSNFFLASFVFAVVLWLCPVHLFSAFVGKLECILFMTFLYPHYSFLSILCECVCVRAHANVFFVSLPRPPHPLLFLVILFLLQLMSININLFPPLLLNWIMWICEWMLFCTYIIIYICEQVLFVYVYTIIPPRLSDPCNFITVL